MIHVYFESDMILAVDETIPYWESAFAHLGELRPFNGEELLPADVRDADALLVRSTIWVSGALLEGSSVRFVGTASAGMDHLDEDYLNSRGIYFTNAAGSNANAVAEYIVAALLLISERHGWKLAGKTLGIIGAGHVGSRVELMTRALGMQVALCDPPLREDTGDPRFRLFYQILDADILTFHVPLTRNGPYPTFHMVDAALLDRLSSHQFLFNAARGAVCDGNALEHSLRTRRIAGAALDVWEGEPKVDRSLLEHVELGTPHIAGFSLNGKVRGTQMLLEQLRLFFHLSSDWDARDCYPQPSLIRPKHGSTGQQAFHSIVQQVYDVSRDDCSLRALQQYEPGTAASGFERLRSEYPLRPEFQHFLVELAQETAELEGTLRTLGFQVSVSRASSGGT